jgi:hypothetical protein
MKNLLSSILILLLGLIGCGDSSNCDYETIYINTMAIQCGSGGFTIDETAEWLRDQGVDVFDSFCGHNSDVRYPMVCGAGTSAINIHVIRSCDLDAAIEIGFKPFESISYELRECQYANSST